MTGSRWHFELWSPDGQQLADLTGRAKSRRITQTRNEAEDIRWQLDLNEFEDYCRRSHVAPATLLQVGRTEVRIRRGTKYLCGGVLMFAAVRTTADSQDLELQAVGFLNWFKRRYTAPLRIYTGVQSTDIAWSLIDESQSKGANWDFGIRRGNVEYAGVHDRTYKDDEIKQSLVNLTNVETAPFDFAFSEDKLFHTYAQLGSVRPEIILSYPGNVRELYAADDATNVANRVDVLGSGTGPSDGVETTAARATVDDLDSQAQYYVAEERLLNSSVSDAATLQTNGRAELARWGHSNQVPDLLVDGNVPPTVTDYGIGDYVTVQTERYATLAHVNALYRVEKRDITVDDDDTESVRLSVSQ